MSQIYGPYAFPTMPVQYERDGKTYPITDGMTLRDYFAAKAMHGFISGSMADGTNFALGDEKTTAKFAYLMADAMLEARK